MNKLLPQAYPLQKGEAFSDCEGVLKLAALTMMYVGIPYNFHMGPEHSDISLQKLRNKGMNCILLTHRVIHDITGITIPQGMQATHIWEDTDLFRFVDAQEVPKLGDIYVFGRETFGREKGCDFTAEFKLHLAVHTGIVLNGSNVLMHTSYKSETCLSSQQVIQENPKHEILYAIKRFRTI